MSSTHIQFDRDSVVSVQTQSITARSSTRNGTRRNLHTRRGSSTLELLESGLTLRAQSNICCWMYFYFIFIFLHISHSQYIILYMRTTVDLSLGPYPWKRNKLRWLYFLVRKLPRILVGYPQRI